MSFSVTDSVRSLCVDIIKRIPDFSFIQIEKVGFSVAMTRSNEKYGVWASITPLKFRNGSSVEINRNSYWMIPEIFNENHQPILYLFTIYVPRFLNLSLSEKLKTVFHELYHISPKFDGDIRRFSGRCYAHGHSREKYDQIVSLFVQKWLERDPPPEIWSFLKMNHNELQKKYGTLVGTRLVLPPKRKITAIQAEEILKKENLL